jgi:hypothetical protein
LNGKPKETGPYERPRHRWDDDIKMYFREFRWGVVDWIHLHKDRDQWLFLMNTVINI